ncbi:MAG: D-alanine--D-alanine ligase [Dehalococcoidia bacterium]|nr:D-alanine--D-alanine ligase [Dehalococcoidia bacterium]MDW8009875.1 D-alanine--D-alanine ligase family protein [Chloroflexota bacterium]
MSAGRLRVAVLFGGRSAEHEVSVVSAQGVLSHMDPDRFQPIPFGVTRQGVWLTPRETEEALKAVPLNSYRPLPSAEGAVPPLRPQVLSALLQADVVFPLIHGPHGEDGTVQGLLELLGLPYVGAGVAASAVGMDKALMKALFRQAGLPTAEFVVISKARWQREPQAVEAEIRERLGLPCFVKPANLGSSVGISKVKVWGDLPRALAEAFRYDHKALVERAVAGREIEVAVLGNHDPIASPPGEVVPHREFYDYRAKYLEEGTRLVAPVALPTAMERRLQEMAIAAFRAIDCAGMARVDFFLAGEEPIVNEINTIPGFTPISMYPRLWEAAGLGYRELITRLIELGLERHRERQGRLYAPE